MEYTSNMSLGRRLQRERENQHWTQEQLAVKINGSVPSINRWENDRAKPRQDMMVALTRVFGKPLDQWGIRKRPYWNILFLRNQFFTGREQIIQRLHKALAAEHTIALSHTRAINGIGGIGKTQTALEYAYRYASEYEAVLWVQADSHEILVSDFAKLAETLDLREKDDTDQFRMISAVKRWLQEHGPWLLIFDNADDLAVVSDFLPRQTGGAILLTTRSQSVGTHIRKLELEKMSREEGVTFLLKRITHCEDDEDPLQRVSDEERQAAEELWEVMDGLPLALDQAAAYIDAKQSTITDYLHLYRTHRKILLQERGSGEHAQEHPDSVATTWSLSFRRIKQKNAAPQSYYSSVPSSRPIPSRKSLSLREEHLSHQRFRHLLPRLYS